MASPAASDPPSVAPPSAAPRAPRSKSREQVGDVALPTVALAGGVVLGVAANAAAYHAGILSAPAAFAVAALLAYLAFTPLHEASHANVAGRNHRFRRLDDAVGWLMGGLLLAPFPTFRALHLEHHGHTNDRDRDPDVWVEARSPLAVLLRCATIMPHYYWTLAAGVRQGRAPYLRVWRSTLVGLAVLLSIAAGLVVAGFGWDILLLWVGPSVAAQTALSLVFDWIPHHPHTGKGRFENTRAIDAPLLPFVTLGQSLHLVHHLYPRVPFYRYPAVFRELEEELTRRRAPVVRWGSRRRAA